MTENNYYLLPGQIYATNEDTLISTILGSCVGVVIYDPVNKVAGLNHYLLPKPLSGESSGHRFGFYAIPELILSVIAMGADHYNLKAKVFGGAHVLGGVSESLDVGSHNVRYAFNYLKSLNIPIVEKNVGGTRGRKICLNTLDFSVKHSLMSEREVA